MRRSCIIAQAPCPGTRKSRTRRAKFNALNKERRQHFGEAATVALSEKLAGFGRDQIDCEVVCFELEEFLQQSVHSAPERKLDQFLDGTKFIRAPHELVFKEQFSSVVDANGKRIENF